MAFMNCFLNFNINFAQPRFGFNFGCFSMPNFFSSMPLFSFNSFNSMPFFQQYFNPMSFNTPSVFNTTNSIPSPTTNFNSVFSGYQTDFSNMWGNSTITAPTFDTFSWSNSTINKSKTPKKSTEKSSYSGSLAEYNPTLGKKLAKIALSNAGHKFNSATKQITNQTKNPDTFTGNCAAYVKMAIRDAGAGDYVSGHGYQMTEILKNNKNFKQISTNSVKLSELPAGTVLVYAKGAQGYSSEYGHTEIVTEDGRAVSDGITDNLYKKPSAIFIPVSA